MGRQLAFWKYDEGIYLDNKKVYETACIEGISIDGLSILPVEDILSKVNEMFKDYDQLDEYNYEDSKGSFTIFVTKQVVMFDCSFDLPEAELNKIIDIMMEYDCPFYDPQIEIRFDGR